MNVLPQTYTAGSAWVRVIIYGTGYSDTITKSVSSVINQSPTYSYNELFFDCPFSASVIVDGSCSSNLTYEWYIEPDEDPIYTGGATFQTTFDDVSWSPGYYTLYCIVKDGLYTMRAPDKVFHLIYPENELDAEITGDEFVCLDDGPGFWDSNTSGGYECNYEFEWYVDDEFKDFASSYATDFPSSGYNPGYHHIDLVVHDGETTLYRGPFQVELGGCMGKSGMGDSLQINPNPADEYIDITIIDKADNVNIISGQTIPLNSNKENKDYTYAVIDNFGKILLKKKTSEKYFRIATSDLISGTYHIQVISAKGKTERQFVVSH